jgi:putative nucleotidyltransferase with HDIG domain
LLDNYPTIGFPQNPLYFPGRKFEIAAMKRSIRTYIKKRLRRNSYLQRLALIWGFLLVMTFILPRAFQLDYQYEVGKVWQQADLYAPFDFPLYRTPAEQAQQLDSALNQVIPIYKHDTLVEKVVLSNLEQRLNRFYTQLRGYQKARLRGNDSLAAQLLREQLQGSYPVDFAAFPADTSPTQPTWLTNLKRSARDGLQSLYEPGYLPIRRDTFPHNFIAITQGPTLRKRLPQDKLFSPEKISPHLKQELEDLPEAYRELLVFLIQEEMQPNLAYDDRATKIEVDRVRRLIIPNMGKVSKGTLVIKQGKMVSVREDRMLSSLAQEKRKRYGKRSSRGIFLSQFLVVFLITAKLLVYLGVNKPRIYFKTNRLGLILTTLFMTVGAMILALKIEELPGAPPDISFIYLAPACIVPILITNFFDERTGFLANLLVALIGAVLVQRGLEFAFVQIMAGTVAVYSLRRLRDRRVFFYTMGYLLIAYVLSFVAFSLYSKGNFEEIPYGNLVLFVFNIALTILAYPLIYVFERFFGITSDLTYLELLDTNHPLLQKLARKAPGSFQHSLQVANLAEAIVQVIGGNALLVHVGALYHDIGKSLQPSYFIENSSLDSNPHDKLACEDSASIIIDHVPNGVKLAQEHKLPKEIIDFIETHHGTTRVEYFYRIHLKEIGQNFCEDEDKYRYPGPLPFSKETAVLMVADSVEAASRSLKNPTEHELESLMNKIIDYKIQEKQFENAPLTFKDIAMMRKVLFKQLLSIYHGRIRYPEEEEVAV